MINLSSSVWGLWWSATGNHVWKKYYNAAASWVTIVISDYSQDPRSAVAKFDSKAAYQQVVHSLAIKSFNVAPLAIKFYGEATCNHLIFEEMPDTHPQLFHVDGSTVSLPRDSSGCLFGELTAKLDRTALNSVGKCHVLGKLMIRYIEGDHAHVVATTAVHDYGISIGA